MSLIHILGCMLLESWVTNLTRGHHSRCTALAKLSSRFYRVSILDCAGVRQNYEHPSVFCRWTSRLAVIGLFNWL